MKIHNVRLGFATNSSSTHSIIYTSEHVEDSDVSDGGFGWGNFTAASLRAKKLYLAATLYSNLEKQISKDIATSVVKDWVGVELTFGEYSVNEYVDHQSLFSLPRDWDGKGINKAFFKEFKEYLLQEGIVILGGNDNGDDIHDLINTGTMQHIPMPKDDRSSWVARKDDSGYWTLFNRATGTKIRFSFNDLDAKPLKSSVPELIDLKITDYCTEGCTFCYQNSTPEGVHASFNVITNIAYAMYDAKVLECALGGGATTDHPDFPKIVKLFKDLDIVPNFTTKSLSWLKEDWAKQVLDDCGGFAYSVTNHKQVPKFVTLMKSVNYPKYPKMLYIHYVLGSTTIAEYRKILEEAYASHVQVTLLGYKTNGRGASFKPHAHENWLAVIKEMRNGGKYIRIGIDTAIVQQYSRTIQLEGISECLYHIEEGKFSCYIDAVTNRIAPSSYSDRDAYHSFDNNWLEIYRKF